MGATGFDLLPPSLSIWCSRKMTKAEEKGEKRRWKGERKKGGKGKRERAKGVAVTRTSPRRRPPFPALNGGRVKEKKTLWRKKRGGKTCHFSSSWRHSSVNISLESTKEKRDREKKEKRGGNTEPRTKLPLLKIWIHSLRRQSWKRGEKKRLREKKRKGTYKNAHPPLLPPLRSYRE